MKVSTKQAAKFGQRYPWDVWLKRDILTLLRGHDFNCEPQSMAVMLRVKVLSRKLSRTIRVIGDTVTMGPKSDNRGRKRER